MIIMRRLFFYHKTLCLRVKFQFNECYSSSLSLQNYETYESLILDISFLSCPWVNFRNEHI